MITKEEWKEFQEYRKGKRLKQMKFLLSINFPRIETVTRKFLFWSWRAVKWPSFQEIEAHCQEVRKNEVALNPPPETVEACLDWLIQKEKENEQKTDC